MAPESSANVALKREIAEIMEPDVRWVPSDMPLERAAEELATNRISGAVVCDIDGSVVGGSGDRSHPFLRRSPRRRLVRDVMTKKILAVRPDERLERAIQVMAFERVHRLVVIDRDGELAGIITSMDVLRELAGYSRAWNR